MKRLLLIILLLFPLSCYDGLSDMLDDLTMKVPICVDASGGDDLNDGRGWRNAKATIQSAVNAAEDGDEIWVAGTHNPAATVIINKDVSLYGGFTGRESRRDQRDVDSRTVVSYTESGEAIRITSKNVVFDTFRIENVISESGAITIGSGSSAVFENCIFSGNTNNNEPGGAISISNAVVKISNSQFYANSSSFGGGAISATGTGAYLTIQRVVFGDKNVVSSGNMGGGTGGGAIYAAGGATVTVTDNTKFYRNNTSMGGAIYVTGSGTTLVIKRAVFGDKDTEGSGNSVTQQGGAIYALNGSAITISDNCEFYRNTSVNQGGAIYLNASTLDVTNSTFGGDSLVTGNKSTGAAGGAICAMNNSDVNLSGTRIKYNSSSGFASGGGIFVSGGNLIIKNRTYIQNNDSPGQGGGIYVEGATTVNISDSFIQNNTSVSTGGGMRSFSSSIVITNTEITGNSTGINSNGGGISFVSNTYDKTLEIYNSRIINNTAGIQGGGGISFSSASSNVDLIIVRTVLDSNSAGSSGGAIYFDSSEINSSITMESCIVSNTSTENGPAVYVYNGINNQFVNSLFYNNRYTTSSTAHGGALSLRSSSLLVNLTFFNNSASNGGAVYLAGSGSTYYMYNTVFYNNTSTDGGTKDTLSTAHNVFLNRYNCFYYNMDVFGGSANPGCITGILSDPFLNSSDPESPNYLRARSDLGDDGLFNNGTVDFSAIIMPFPDFTMPATDLAGNTRIRGGAIDIGAYERQ